MQESACRETSGTIKLRCESLPFSAIPGQSKLFLEYQNDPTSLRNFYPTAVGTHDELAARVPEVLRYYKTDRQVLCDILVDQNARFASSDASLANIEHLREADAVAVVTGQQAGLFTGPLYTVYKALTAIRSAECLRGQGINAVPIFWMATEDHDFEEVSNVFGISANGELIEAKFSVSDADAGKPVGAIRFDDSISSVIEEWFSEMQQTEFSSAVREVVENTFISGSTFGDSFGKLLAKLFGKYGLIILDPLDERLKRLAAPIYVAAAERSDDIVTALTARSRELEKSGYHAQVLVNEDYFPLFWHGVDGNRTAMKRIRPGVYRVRGGKTEMTTDEIAHIATSDPQRFSPGVMLRSVVQDYLLPTLCYYGGGAEIAYFAQNSEVYRLLYRPVTPIIHRQSFTVFEAKHERVLNKFELKLSDLFAGLDALLPGIVEWYIDPETPKVFADVEEKVNTELNRLDQHLSKIDPTLAESLAKRRRKIIYHIGALRNKFRRARIEKDETINRQIGAAFTALLPNGGLQERTINVASFMNRHGFHFIDWMYDAIDLDDKGHRIVYL